MVSFRLPAFLCVAVISSMALVSHSALIGMCADGCPEGWAAHNGRCFRFIAEKKSWIDAELNCLDLGGNLASEHDANDHLFLKDLYKSIDSSNEPFWIGLSAHERRIWLWSDGSNAKDFTMWNEGEPNDSGGEACVHSNFGDGDWNDIGCDLEYASFCVLRPTLTIRPGCLQGIPPSNQPYFY